MDWNLSYSYVYASTILLGVSVGLIKFSEYVKGMCISNTNLIIRQSDQIHFLLNRLIELDKKMIRLKNEVTTLTETNVSLSSLSIVDEIEFEEKELKEDEIEFEEKKLKEDEIEFEEKELKEDEIEFEEKELKEDEIEFEEKRESTEEVFELINNRVSPVTTTTTTTTSNKKSSWLSFLF
jgi:hypothetical protein